MLDDISNAADEDTNFKSSLSVGFCPRVKINDRSFSYFSLLFIIIAELL